MVTSQWAGLAGWRIKKRLKLLGFVVGRFPPIKWVDQARSPTCNASGLFLHAGRSLRPQGLM